MKKTLFVFFVIAALFITSAAFAEEEMPPLPDADGAALAEYILETNPYTEWGTFPADGESDFLGMILEGGEPHGAFVRIYANDIAVEAAAEFEGEMPYGSIVVKENYMATEEGEPGDLAALTVMYKIEGFNPDAGDWFWLKSQPDGTIDAEGTVEGCIGCHGQEGNVDYLLRYGFGEAPVVSRGPVFPGPDGAQIMEYALETDPYTEWGAWPADDWSDFAGFLPSGAPHGETVRFYVNQVALDAAETIREKKAEMMEDEEAEPMLLPAGSIIVKENYPGTPDEPGDLAAITIMYKIEGFNPEANDWFWLKAQPDGTVDAEGAVEGCIGCHSQEGHADYMLRYNFGEAPAVPRE